jgi:probable HAF family extracellular repeat protein
MRSKLGIGRLAASLALSLGMSAPAWADQIYRVTDLGNLQVSGITRDGRVIGDEIYTSGPNRGERLSVIYQDGTKTPVTVPGTGQNVAYAVMSPGGTIAYSAVLNANPSPGTTHVIKDGRVYDAGTASDGYLVGGGEYSVPHAVNDAGVVAGESHAYGRWNRAFMSSPDPVSGAYRPVAMGANGGSVSNAFGVNSQGTVVGWSDVVLKWKNHAFVGTPSNDIGTLGGANSMALAINDKGQVVGWSDTGTDPNSSWPQHAFLYDSKGMHDLGTLPGVANSMALAINSLGQSVGSSGDRAVLFASGQVVDLTQLLPSVSGWVLKRASGINDLGQIIGTGTLDGATHSFLLTPTGEPLPVPEPATWALFAIAALAYAGRRLRAR